MFGLGMGELILIFLIVLLLFGASRLPEIARALGKSMGEFKKGANEVRNDIEKTAAEAYNGEDEKPEKKDEQVS